MKELSERYPIRTSFVLILVLFSLRIADVFVIRSDELFGEQVLTKILGLVLIIAYVLYIKGGLENIGLHSRNWKLSVILGLSITASGLLTGYVAEWVYLLFAGAAPTFYVAPQGHTLIPEDASTGGVIFGLTLLAGNIVNSFMEEGFFRGVLITHLSSQASLQKANLIQAAIFGIWHIVWPIRDYLDGQTDLSVAVGISVGYIFLSGMIGFAWGYFYQKTNSLWTSWSAHTLNNSAINFVHIKTATGIPSTLGLRVGVSTFVVVTLLPIVKKATETRKIREVETWV